MDIVLPQPGDTPGKKKFMGDNENPDSKTWYETGDHTGFTYFSFNTPCAGLSPFNPSVRQSRQWCRQILYVPDELVNVNRPGCNLFLLCEAGIPVPATHEIISHGYGIGRIHIHRAAVNSDAGYPAPDRKRGVIGTGKS